MIVGIRNTCIFMLAAQALLFFVPGQSYEKYVRVLVGIVMIFQISGPLLRFFLSEGEYQQILQQGKRMEEEINQIYDSYEIQGKQTGIYEGIERELQSRLKAAAPDYEVLQVRILDQEGRVLQEGSGEMEAEKIQVVVRKKQREKRIEPIRFGEGEHKERAEKEEELKALYGASIHVEPQRIEIVTRG